ncbi:hypothetical protein AA313_de0201775 [Arthrobotrys entomopaga]|nr:hypothetical protein AA313_de0201775 [Arthrobotrys entomopaga]
MEASPKFVDLKAFFAAQSNQSKENILHLFRRHLRTRGETASLEDFNLPGHGRYRSDIAHLWPPSQAKKNAKKEMKEKKRARKLQGEGSEDLPMAELREHLPQLPPSTSMTPSRASQTYVERQGSADPMPSLENSEWRLKPSPYDKIPALGRGVGDAYEPAGAGDLASPYQRGELAARPHPGSWDLGCFLAPSASNAGPSTGSSHSHGYQRPVQEEGEEKGEVGNTPFPWGSYRGMMRGGRRAEGEGAPVGQQQ